MVRVRAGRAHRCCCWCWCWCVLWGPTIKKKAVEGGCSASPPMHSLQGMFAGNPFQMSTWRSFVVVVVVGGCGGGGGGGAYWGLRSWCGCLLEGATVK